MNVFFYGVLLFGLVLFFYTGITEAQTLPCLKYPSSSIPPTGYGASWDVTSAFRELVIKSNCPSSGNSLDITIGKGSATQFVWATAYVYGGSTWTAHTLSGVSGGAGWLIGRGDKTITTPFSPTPANPLFFVGYLCTPAGAGWKCGCANSSCTAPFWQVQAYMGATSTEGESRPIGPELALCYPGSGSRTVPVDGPSDLPGKISSARPGDHLVLSGGSYSGFSYNQNGSSDNPIVIKPASGASVTFTGSITFDGSYGVLTGVTIQNGSVNMHGHHNRLTRNTIVGTTVYMDDEKGQHYFNRVDHNTFRDQTGEMINIQVRDGAEKHQGHRVDHNLFSNHRRNCNNNQEAVINWWEDHFGDGNSLIDSNIFDNVLQGNTGSNCGQNESFSMKTSNLKAVGNTWINSPNAMLTFRQSSNSIAENNYFGPGTGGINVNGENNVIRGNRLEGGRIAVLDGDGTLETRQCSGGKWDRVPSLRQGSECVGVHVIARNTVVSNNVGSIQNSGVNTQMSSNGASANTSARRLNYNEVGPSSADPSCTTGGGTTGGSTGGGSGWVEQSGFSLQSYGGQWRLHNREGGSATQITNGINLRSIQDSNIGDGVAPHAAWIVSRNAVDIGSGIEVEFDYRITDNLTEATAADNGVFTTIGLYRGDGASGHPSNLGQWNDVTESRTEQTGSTVWHSFAARASFAQRAPAGESGESNSFRIRVFDGSGNYGSSMQFTPNDSEYSGPQNIVINSGVTYRVRYRIEGNRASLRVTNGSSVQEASITTNLMVRTGMQNVVIRNAGGRIADITNIVVRKK